jgi:hypothetical protein
MSAEPEAFSFSHTHRFTEEQYAELKGLPSRKKRWIRWALIMLAAIACLFSIYTILLGIGLIVLLALGLWMPRLIPGTAAKIFHANPMLQSDIRYGVDNTGLSIDCDTLTARVPWRGIAVWEEKCGWLRLAPNGMPECWFKITELKEAGVYDRVLALCRSNGVEYG